MIKIETRALLHMLQQVSPHMDDPGNHMPVISSIRLEARGGWLYAIATDRFTMAAARRPILATDDRTAHVPGHLVPTLTAWLEAEADYVSDVNLQLPDDQDPTTIAFYAPGRSDLKIDSEPDDYKHYPNWRKTFHAALTAEPCPIPVTGYTTKFLARWQHASDKLTAWQQAPNKAIVLLDHLGYFAGLHMPVRGEQTRTEAAGDWIAATKPTATIDGDVYDLTMTWEDAHGDPWTYSGEDTPDGMPLMVLGDIDDDPHPLDRLITQYGPLTLA